MTCSVRPVIQTDRWKWCLCCFRIDYCLQWKAFSLLLLVWRLLIIRGKYLPKSTLCWKRAICQVMVMTVNIWKPLGQSSPCQVKAGFSHVMFFKNTPLSISDKCQAVLPSLNLICASHFSIPFSFVNYSSLSKNVLKESIIY